jgi:GT2 family glycosyltransferase
MKSTTPRKKLRWRGALEGVHKGLLYGWAIDTAHPDARVVLEVCLDEQIISSVIADAARSDLADTFASALKNAAIDPCHGFVADLGIHFADMSGSVTVRIANTDEVLRGAVQLEKPKLPPSAVASHVFGDGALRLHGWVYDMSNATRQLQVRAYAGDRLLAITRADLEHPSMRAQEVGPHGFDLDLPLDLADGKVHTVRVVDEDGQALNGSPLTVCCFAGGMKALLPSPQESLLGDLAEQVEHYLPRSIGMRQYGAWRAQFEQPAALDVPTLRVGILLTGQGDEAAIERSIASLNHAGAAQVQVFVPSPGTSFTELLQQALASGSEVLGCLRIGDTLAPGGLAHALQGFALPDAQLVYTDSEFNGKPWLKPAWNPDYALSTDYPLELLLVRTAVLAGVPRLPTDAAGFAWQALTAVWQSGTRAIIHVPRIAYCFQSALSTEELTERGNAAQRLVHALEPSCRLLPQPASTAHCPYPARRVQRTLSPQERSTKVSLIIPTRDYPEMLKRCIDSIQQFTDWPNLEIIVIDNGSVQTDTKAYFRQISRQGVKVLSMPGPFNFADLNNRAVAAASGEIIGLVNNDIEALHEGWLDELVSQLLRPEVGAVGAKLLWPNGMVQHGGVLLGVGNVAGHFGNRLSRDDCGDHARNQVVQQVSGVTAACLLLHKSDYLAVGGMDPVAFPVAFNDVDLCLKLRKAGKLITWTPYATLLHAESASRGHEDTPQKRARSLREIDNLRQRWGMALLRDPAYHPSLNLDPHSHAFGGLALPPRDRSPRHGRLPVEEEVL